MGNAPRILITGASGLLGKHLVQESIDQGIQVLGQYHRHKPDLREACQWLQGDFSTVELTGKFLNTHSHQIKTCDYLINNYGPITQKDISDLTEDDFLKDFIGNLLVPLEIIRFFLSHSKVKSVVNLGFDKTDSPRPFRTVLTYAMAKQNLLSLTLSLAKKHRNIRFNMISPGTMTGASIRAPRVKPIPPKKVAEETIKLLLSPQTGQNIIIR